MSNTNPIKLLLFFITILTFQCPLAYGKDEVIIVGNHAPPFRIIEGNEFSGIYFDIAKEIFSRLEIEIVFKEQPFKRALFSIASGSADVMMGPNKTAGRETYMTYVELVKLSRENKAFYVHPDSTPISSYEDLEGKKIGIHRGKVYFENLTTTSLLKKRHLIPMKIAWKWSC